MVHLGVVTIVMVGGDGKPGPKGAQIVLAAAENGMLGAFGVTFDKGRLRLKFLDQIVQVRTGTG